MPEENCYICPEGKPLKYVGINPLNRTHLYYSTPEALWRLLTEEPLHARQVSEYNHPHLCASAAASTCPGQTPAFAISQRARRKVEALFAELKNYIGLRRLRLRRMRFVREQFYLAATVQNLKRLVRFLTRRLELQTLTA